MTVNEEDHHLTRQRIHDLADSIGAVVTKVAVIEERQKGVTQQLDRIETAVTALPAKVAVLESQAANAANSGAKWGAGVGAAVSGLVSGLAAIFRGGQ